MKKSQILAALALAFALGVVAPVMSASATTVADGEVATFEEADKALQDNINTAINSCGWHMVGTVKTYYYNQFVNLSSVIETAEETVSDATDAQLDTLKTAYNATISALKTTLDGYNILLPAGVATTLPDSVDTYDKAVTYLTNAGQALVAAAAAYNGPSINGVPTAYDTAINKLSDKTYGATPTKGALKQATDNIESVKWNQAKLIEAALASIKDETARTNVKYDNVLAEAKTLVIRDNGVCSVAIVDNMKPAIDTASKILRSTSNFSLAEINQTIAAIKKAVKGETVADTDLPSTDPDTTLKPGNTGLVGSAEGTATTVSIVAGLATALTALGAGVVVYRNARREK